MTLHITSKQTLITLVALGLFAGMPATYAHGEEGDNDSAVSVEAGARTEVRAEQVLPLRQRIERRKEDLRERTRERTEERRDGVEVRTDVRTEVRTQQRDDHSEVSDDRREQAEERHDEAVERREEKKAELAQNFSERIQNHLKRFVRLLGASIDRIEGFIARIEARADAFDEAGKDTSVARAHLDTAVGELLEAESDLALIGVDIETAFSTDGELTRELLRSAFADTKDAINSAKKHIRAAHAEVREALNALKRLVVVDVETDVAAGAEGDAQ